MNGKTIGIDIRSLSGVHTGVAAYTAGLLLAVFARDTAHEFILFDNQYRAADSYEEWSYPHVTVLRTRYPNKLFSLATAIGRPKIDLCIQKRVGRIDTFFSPNLNFTPLSSDIKHILTIHDLSFEHFADCFSKKRQWWHTAIRAKRQCQRADRIIVPSAHTKYDLVATYGIDPNKITMIPLGVVQTAIDEQAESSCVERYALHKPFILFVGTIEPRKNILSLIEAFRMLHRENIQLILAGAPGWNNRAIRRAIHATPGVRYIGYVSEQEKTILYKCAAMFVYPSLYEGFGLPVLEAMAAGTPVIASHHGSLPEVVEDCAYLVNPRNISELTQAITHCLDNRLLAQQLSQKSLRRSAAYSWDMAAKQFLSCI